MLSLVDGDSGWIACTLDLSREADPFPFHTSLNAGGCRSNTSLGGPVRGAHLTPDRRSEQLQYCGERPNASLVLKSFWTAADCSAGEPRTICFPTGSTPVQCQSMKVAARGAPRLASSFGAQHQLPAM